MVATLRKTHPALVVPFVVRVVLVAVTLVAVTPVALFLSVVGEELLLGLVGVVVELVAPCPEWPEMFLRRKN